MIALLFISFAALLVLGVPIAASIAASALLTIDQVGLPAVLTVQRMFNGADSFPLMAIPFFMMSGAIMEMGGVSRRLMNLVSLFFERLPGGYAIITIVTSMLFGAISGSSPATVAAIGGICVPEMVKQKYYDKFALATAATAGCLGAIIPPSVIMVTYCLATNMSIGDMFLVGILPGIVLTAGFSIYAFIEGARQGYYNPAPPKRSRKQIAWIVIEAIPALLMPIIILGGVYSGVFTATEAGNVAVIYGFIAGFVIYRELKIRDLPRLFRTTTINTSMILFIIAAANAFGNIMTRLKVPALSSQLIIEVSSGPLMFLLFVNVLLIVVGTFMETNSAAMLLAPLLAPVAKAYGIDLLHFGIIMIINLVLGMITPPVGINLYVAAGITKSKMQRTLGKPLIMYNIIGFGLLGLFTYWPGFTMSLFYYIRS